MSTIKVNKDKLDLVLSLDICLEIQDKDQTFDQLCIDEDGNVLEPNKKMCTRCLRTYVEYKV